VPQSLPEASDGFDKQFTFSAKSGKKYDIVNLPVEDKDTLVRVYLNTSSTSTSHSKITVYLLPPKSHAKTRRENAAKFMKHAVKDYVSEVLGVTDPALHQFTVVVKASTDGEPYRLKIEYDSSSSQEG